MSGRKASDRPAIIAMSLNGGSSGWCAGRTLPAGWWLGVLLGAVVISTSLGCTNDGEGQAQEDARIDLEAFAARLPELVERQGVDEGAWQAAYSARRPSLAHPDEALEARKWAQGKNIFARAGALTPAGARLHAALSGSRFEGLDPARAHVPEIEGLLKELEASAASLEALSASAPALTEDQREALEDAAEGVVEGAEGVDDLLLKALMKASAGAPLESWSARYTAAVAEVRGKTLELEVLLLDGAAVHVADMTPPRPAPLDSKEATEPVEAVSDRQRTLLKALIEAGAGPSPEQAVGAALKALWPRTPQYGRLLEAAERYEAIVKAGGWPTEMPRIPEPPSPKEAFQYKANFKKYPPGVVEKVKARLAGERLYDGPINNTWDKALTEAVVRYRRNNQLRDKPWIDYEMTRAMMVPAEFRLAQIKLNLKRLRESPFGDDPFAIHVNLPEFKARVWEGGQKTMEFKVIVGSRKKVRDKKTREWRFQDATPIFSKKMEQIVLSPSWMVPSRIRVELERKADKEPGYYKKYGYEIFGSGANMQLRQKPGSDNALGRVKFLFPNEHDIYMHDTADKDLFWHQVRAFSHGCMRVEDPLDLALYLLKRQEPEWTKRRLSLKAHSGIETPIDLVDGPVVHIDYVTVRVTGKGEVRFFWDIYHRDVAAIKAAEGLEMPVDLHYP